MDGIDAGPVLPSYARSIRDKIRYGRRHETSLLSGSQNRDEGGAQMELRLPVLGYFCVHAGQDIRRTTHQSHHATIPRLEILGPRRSYGDHGTCQCAG